jgi:hypothetical protein
MGFFGKKGQKTANAVSKEPEYADRIVTHHMPDRYLKIVSSGTKKGGGKKWLILVVVVVLLVAGGAVAFLYLQGGKTKGKKAVVSKTEKRAGLLIQPNTNVNTNINVNANVNTNVNSRADENVNSQAGDGANANGSVNGNINNNTNTNTNTNTTVIQTEVLPAPDADEDGLSDEEEDLFGTHIRIPDTDGDGYIDGAEVMNLYDPKTRGGKRLSDSSFVGVYKSKVYSFEYLYPKKWNIASDSDKEIVYDDGKGGRVIALVELVKLAETPTFEAWYKSQSGASVSYENLRISPVKEGLTLYQEEDSLKAYFVTENFDFVYIFEYEPGPDSKAYFKQVFQMMLKSFDLPVIIIRDGVISTQ